MKGFEEYRLKLDLFVPVPEKLLSHFVTRWPIGIKLQNTCCFLVYFTEFHGFVKKHSCDVSIKVHTNKFQCSLKSISSFEY